MLLQNKEAQAKREGEHKLVQQNDDIVAAEHAKAEAETKAKQAEIDAQIKAQLAAYDAGKGKSGTVVSDFMFN